MKRYLVYFFKAGDALALGQCKGNFYQRKGAYQTHSPYPVELLGVIECETEADMQELERTLINQFAEHNLRGEWFALAPEILTYIQDYADCELGEQALKEGRISRRERGRINQRNRRKDPNVRARDRELRQKYQRERRKDPEYKERERKQEQERRKDPEYRERKREYQRNRRKDPNVRAQAREYQRKREQELMKNPEYRERKRKYDREYRRKRYQSDPAFRERRRQRYQRDKRKKQSINGEQLTLF